MHVVLADGAVALGDLFGREAVAQTEDPLEGAPELLAEPAVEDEVARRLQRQQDLADQLEHEEPVRVDGGVETDDVVVGDHGVVDDVRALTQKERHDDGQQHESDLHLLRGYDGLQGTAYSQVVTKVPARLPDLEDQTKIQHKEDAEGQDGGEDSVHDPGVQAGVVGVAHPGDGAEADPVHGDGVELEVEEVGDARDEGEDGEHDDDGAGATHVADGHGAQRVADGDVALDGQHHRHPHRRQVRRVHQDARVVVEDDVHAGVDGVAVRPVHLPQQDLDGHDEQEEQVGDGQGDEVAVGRRAHRLAAQHDDGEDDADDAAAAHHGEDGRLEERRGHHVVLGGHVVVRAVRVVRVGVVVGGIVGSVPRGGGVVTQDGRCCVEEQVRAVQEHVRAVLQHVRAVH